MDRHDIRILKPGDETLLEKFLLPRLETSMFLIGSLRTGGLTDTGGTYTGAYAALFEGNGITGVAAHYWNRNMIIQAPVHPELLCKAAARASGRPLEGFLGPYEQVAAVMEGLNIQKRDIQFDSKEILYSLELKNLIVPGKLNSGELTGRRIEPGDLDTLTGWRMGFCLEALGKEESPGLREQSRSLMERLMKEKRSWIIEKDGIPVATSSFNVGTRDAIQIGGVWTPPELRKRGYGRSAVAASLLDTRAEGIRQAILFTGTGNIGAQKTYEALGFKQIGNYRTVRINNQEDNMWDKRYSKKEYVFGINPNKFLVSVAGEIPGGRVLCLAEGEGRNAVYLAEQGYEVLAVDSSKVGLEKARKLAESRGAKIQTVAADLGDFEIEENHWDAIVSIFCHLPPAIRKSLHKKVIRGLRPGGVFVLEAYTPAQLKYNTGGPKSEELLISLSTLKTELSGLEFKIERETERNIIEGEFHTGISAIVQVLAVRR